MKLKKNIACLLAALGVSVVATPVMAYEAGDILVRARIIKVDPQGDSNGISVDGSNTGVEASADTDTMPELDFTYMLERHWGLELILAYTEHNANTSLLGLGKFANTKVLPPTLTLQYHFSPDSNIRPYVGAGVNYTHFFDSEVKGALDGPSVDLDIDDSWGLAAQAGVDIDVNEDWFVNFDVKYIDISADAHIKGGVGPSVKVDIDVDPIVWGIGVGRRF
ncbi:MAG: OmpW family outer membrane protein [Cycloclasticus sp.]